MAKRNNWTFRRWKALLKA